MSALTAEQINPGRCYRAKKPRRVGFYGYYDDRQVAWVSSDRARVQYDSPTVRDGRRYPTISMSAFLSWAGSDVTAFMPKGEWMVKP